MTHPDSDARTDGKLADAAISIIHEGAQPTIQRIRDKIGGSPNDIGPKLKAWKTSPQGQAALADLDQLGPPGRLDTDEAMDQAVLAALAPLRTQLRAEGQQAADTLKAEKDADIEQLQAQLAASERALKATQAELSDQQEALQRLNADHAGALKTIEEQKECLVRSDERITALEQQLKESNALKNAAQTQAHRERERLERTRDGHLEQLHNLQLEHGVAIANKEHAIDRAREAQQGCEQRIIDLEKANAVATQERNTLKSQKVPQLQSEIEGLNQLLSDSERANDSLQKNIARTDTDNTTLKVANKHLLECQERDQRTIVKLESQVQSLVAEGQETKKALASKDQHIQQLTEKLLE